MWQLVLATVLLMTLTAPLAADVDCPGDCDADGTVTPAEFAFVTACFASALGQPLTVECLECAGLTETDPFPINHLIRIGNLAVLGCPGRPRCDGDCDGDRRVVIAEVLYGVGAALNGTPLDDRCPDFAFCPQDRVCLQISTLQRAVDNALGGCPAWDVQAESD